MGKIETGLGQALRAWRDRLSPHAAGLPHRQVRRTAGLRREELAELAGLSVEYVVRLEQGRARAPSRQVIVGLARALQLSDAERDHLHWLAGLAPPAEGGLSERIPSGVSRVLGRVGDAAAAVFAADWRLVWWNSAWASLLGDPTSVPVPLRNFALDTFPIDETGPRLYQWPVTPLSGSTAEAAVVADLRRATGRLAGNGRLLDLITALNAGSPAFAALWASGDVGRHRSSRKIVHHPSAGDTTVDCDVLVDGDTDLKIVLLTAAHGTEDEARLRLSAVAGLTEPARI